jgi:hypothetical protein
VALKDAHFNDDDNIIIMIITVIIFSSRGKEKSALTNISAPLSNNWHKRAMR